VREDFYSADAGVMRPSAIRAMSKLIARPGIISFAPGYPSPQTFPADEIAEIAGRVIREQSGAGLQYGLTRGYGPLLGEVSALMQERGVSAGLERVLLTSGSQQGLDLLARVLIDPGDVMGQPFHVDGSGSETLRLAYGKEGEEQIARGIEKLAGVVRARLVAQRR